MKKHWLLAAIYPPGTGEDITKVSLIIIYWIVYIVAVVFPMMIYTMVHEAQITRKSYVQWLCLHKQVHL